ncbi:TauD/TfdA dioxygenase family protein [Hyphococcus sp.]|jgi:alpha-ketoglutarate-dependent 2,4-dichlorophenoxyacetate dioxygenase|uniref:TauD/TfdA dioxygenase family protein n=1 Tax=Hyphococcus sp. TaxID=2038636 RepID=UPI003D13233A
MTYQVNSLHPLFAAEMLGFDLDAEITTEDVDLVEHLMAEHAVLVLRGLTPSDEGHLRFARSFGPLELPPKMSDRPSTLKYRISPELYDISNLDADGTIIPADDPRTKFNLGNERFHTDSSFNALPSKWSLLLSYETPAEGANTEFIDTRVVYDSLSDGMKKRLEGLKAVHDLWGVRAKYEYGGAVSEEMRRLMPPVEHDVVRVSASGRKALYIGKHASHIVGMDEKESDALLAELMEFATEPRFIYSHQWRPGDLLIWDNRCTLHRGTTFNRFTDRRDLRRATINEYGPETSSTGALMANAAQ